MNTIKAQIHDFVWPSGDVVSSCIPSFFPQTFFGHFTLWKVQSGYIYDLKIVYGGYTDEKFDLHAEANCEDS